MVEDTAPEQPRYDLAAAGVGVGGGIAGSIAGSFLGPFGGGVGVLCVGLGLLGISKTNSRHLLIGALFGTVTYIAGILSSSIGYNSGKERQVISFDTGRDRGVVVERYDGTRIPYVFDEKGQLASLSELEKRANEKNREELGTKREEILAATTQKSDFSDRK